MNWAEFHFLRPWWWLAVLPAVFILLKLLRNRQQQGNWASICDAELLPFILQDKPSQPNRNGLGWAALAVLLVIIALAGPTWQRLPSPAFRNDAALVIALDLSQSMDAADIKPSRLTKARYKIADILKQRKDGQTALLVYGGDAFTVTPLTTDNATIASQLNALTTDIMPSQGSNAVVGINKATELLRHAGVAQGHILLITDGIDDDSIRQIPTHLGDYQLSILGVGSNEGAPIKQTGGGFLKDEQGNIVVAKLDETSLMALAQSGHGIYQTVTADDSDVDNLGAHFNSVNANDNSQASELTLQQWDEKGPWLALLVIPWAALRFRKGLLMALLVMGLTPPQNAHAFDWQNLWQTPDQRAQQAFNQNRFDQAAEQFDHPDWKAAAQYKAGQYAQAAETLKDSPSADGQYNRGNALANAGQLQEAVQAYQQALKLNPQHTDAQYNKALVEKKLQEQQKDQQQDQNQSSDKQDNQQQDQKQDQQQNGDADNKPQDQSQQDQQQQDQQGKDQDQPKPDQQSKDQAAPKPEPDKTDKPSEQAKPQPEPEQQAEQQQQAAQPKPDQQALRAGQQMLKRIPDEPTGLLKRKFKYQYSQRQQAAKGGSKY